MELNPKIMYSVKECIQNFDQESSWKVTDLENWDNIKMGGLHVYVVLKVSNADPISLFIFYNFPVPEYNTDIRRFGG